MSFSKFVWNRHPVRVSLKHTAGALASVYFNKADMDGTGVWGRQDNLADALHVSVKTVQRAQQHLESVGLIALVRCGSNYRGLSNEYRLTMPTEKSSSDICDHLIGHLCPTSSVTGDRLINPVIEPGNRPGSTASEAFIFDDRPGGHLVEPSSHGWVLPVEDEGIETDPFPTTAQESSVFTFSQSLDRIAEDQPKEVRKDNPWTTDPLDQWEKEQTA